MNAETCKRPQTSSQKKENHVDDKFSFCNIPAPRTSTQYGWSAMAAGFADLEGTQPMRTTQQDWASRLVAFSTPTTERPLIQRKFVPKQLGDIRSPNLLIGSSKVERTITRRRTPPHLLSTKHHRSMRLAVSLWLAASHLYGKMCTGIGSMKPSSRLFRRQKQVYY